jgi:hypothetical protein
MNRILILSIIVFFCSKITSQTVIEPLEFENLNIEWSALMLDSSRINSFNNGADHLLSYPVRNGVQLEGKLYNLYLSFYDLDIYDPGFCLESIDINDGTSNIFCRYIDQSIREEMPISIMAKDGNLELFTAKSNKQADNNIPMFIFNAFSNLNNYTLDTELTLLSKNDQSNTEDSFLFIYPGSNILGFDKVGDEYNVLQGFIDQVDGFNIYGYTIKSLSQDGMVISTSDTLFMDYHPNISGFYQLSHNALHNHGDNWIFNHSLISEDSPEKSTLEVMIIDKSDIHNFKRIDCTPYFSNPGVFLIAGISDSLIYIRNDEDPSDFNTKWKMIILDKAGNLVEEIEEVSADGYNYGGYFPVHLPDNNISLIVGSNREKNTLDFLQTDGNGNLIKIEEAILSDSLLVFIPRNVIEDKESIIVRGVLRRSINDGANFEGYWNYTFSIDKKELDFLSSTISEFSNDNIKIYPNPNNGSFSIELPEACSGHYFIYDVSGSLIYKSAFNSTDKLTSNKTYNHSGIYYVNIISNKGNFNQRVVISQE